MNYSTFRFNLDLHTMQSQISIPVKYGDTAVRLLISLTDGGLPLAIEDGCRAVFSAKKADNTTILNNCVIEKNSIIRYDFTEHTATAEGIAKCEIILYGLNGEALGSPRFVIVVDKRVIGGDDVISQSERNAVDQIIILGTEAVANEEERKGNEIERKEAEVQRQINEANRQRLYNFTADDAGKFVKIDADGTIIATDVEIGGGKLYMHYVKIYATNYNGFVEIFFHVLSKNNTEITMMNLANYIPENVMLSATGYCSSEMSFGQVDKFYFIDNEGYINVNFWDERNNSRYSDGYSYAESPEDFTVTDTIMEVV